MNMDNKVSEMEELWWVARTRAFLGIPNPAVLKVYFLSSFATFTSGIVLAGEWMAHGKNHAGFMWIIYYASFLILLPLVNLTGLVLMVIFYSRGGCSSQIADSVAAKEACTEDVSKAQGGTEEMKINSCTSLALVVDPVERNNKEKEEKVRGLKRAVSFPMHREVRSCRTR